MRVLDCGAAKSLCGAKPIAQMAQTCAREWKRVGDERDTEALDESYHFRGIGNQMVSSFMKLPVPESIDGKEVSFAPSITPGDIRPLVGNDHLIPWGCSINLYPDELLARNPISWHRCKVACDYLESYPCSTLQILQAWRSMTTMCGPRSVTTRE